MAYCGYITRLKNVRKHSNADRLLCGECFGNKVIVSLDYKENQLGVYFPVDGKLNEEFANKNNHPAQSKTNKKKKTITYPFFEEHIDTAQLCYNLNAFKGGDLIEITLKMHGTSQRTAYTVMKREEVYPYLIYKIRQLLKLKTKESYEYISGTRRCTLENYDGGYYGDNSFREQHHNKFVGKLHKGEEVFYEVIGFTDEGKPIMPTVSNKKLNDKEFIKKYGEETVFSYGCKPKTSIDCDDLQSDIYVYRMTMTNPDGEVVEYTYDYMKYRCEQMDVKVVPMLWRGIIPEEVDTEEYVKAKAEEYYDGIDPIGKTHWREGVVVRIVNRPKFTAYKHKNFTFKVLEGIAKDTATEADIEEAQEVSAT